MPLIWPEYFWAAPTDTDVSNWLLVHLTPSDMITQEPRSITSSQEVGEKCIKEGSAEAEQAQGFSTTARWWRWWPVAGLELMAELQRQSLLGTILQRNTGYGGPSSSSTQWRPKNRWAHTSKREDGTRWFCSVQFFCELISFCTSTYSWNEEIIPYMCA